MNKEPIRKTSFGAKELARPGHVCQQQDGVHVQLRGSLVAHTGVIWSPTDGSIVQCSRI